MRLVTRRAYRAFPELDIFSDAACRIYQRRAKSHPAYLVTCMLAMFTVFTVAAAFCWKVAAMIEFVIGLSRLPVGADAIVTAAEAVILLTLVAVPQIAALMARDAVLRFFLHRAINRTRCLGCGYLLLGQPVADGALTCSECGRPTSLMELGLTGPDELDPAKAA